MFLRYSATRRTRRYKRNQDNNEASISTDNAVPVETHIIKQPTHATHIEVSEPISIEPEVDKETRLKVWQEKLKSQMDQDGKSGRRYRNQTGINPADVELALKRKDNPNVSTTFISPEPIKVRYISLNRRF